MNNIKNDKEEILNFHLKLWSNLINLNFKELDKMYPENYRIRHAGNVYQKKDEWYETLRNGTFKYYTYNPVKHSVTINGDKAILYAISKTDARIYGHRKIWNMDFHIPYEKVNGRWRIARE